LPGLDQHHQRALHARRARAHGQIEHRHGEDAAHRADRAANHSAWVGEWMKARGTICGMVMIVPQNSSLPRLTCFAQPAVEDEHRNERGREDRLEVAIDRVGGVQLVGQVILQRRVRRQGANWNMKMISTAG